MQNKRVQPTDDKSASCDVNEALDALSHAVSVAQHHDAVTGTEKQYVTEDYHYRLDKGVQDFLSCAYETSEIQIQLWLTIKAPLLELSN